MSTLHIELSEYDAMRNRNKELEERVKQLEEELKGCKDGYRVIIRKVMEQKEAGRFSYYDHLQGRPIYGSEQSKEIVVSENYINFEDVREKIEDKMKDAIEASIRFHNEQADKYSRKENSLENEYSEKKSKLEQEYEEKKSKLYEKFGNEIKNLKAERDKVKTENAELKRRAREKFSSISNLAVEATERLESMWFKPSHAISLVREIANMAN